MSENGDRKSISGTFFRPEEGKLYVFKPNRIEVLKSWPHIMAWRKTRGKPGWVHFRPKISMPAKDVGNRIRCLEGNEDDYGQKYLFIPPELLKVRREELAWLKWYSTIPRELRDLIRGFPARHWHLLSFLARCGKAAIELTSSNPALAWALASNWIFHNPPVQRPLRAACSVLRKKQRDILAWLGFPPTEAARRVLAKVIPRAVRTNDLRALRKAMGRADVLNTTSPIAQVLREACAILHTVARIRTKPSI